MGFSGFRVGREEFDGPAGMPALPGALRHSGSSSGGGEGEEDGEGGSSFGGLGFDPDVSAVGFDEVADGDEAEARTLFLAGGAPA